MLSKSGGYGRAHKIQVKNMVKNFLNLDGRLSYDCADALAVAICHINSKILRDKIPSGDI